MKVIWVNFWAMLATLGAFGETVPTISTYPQSTTVLPGSNVTFTVASPNATAYQWRFNGTDILGATSASLVITNAQTNHIGYYVAIAKNAIGWTPTPMAFLSVVWSNGILPFYNCTYYSSPPLVPPNCTNEFSRARYGYNSSCRDQPIGGTAQIVAGPARDELRPVGTTTDVANGYYGWLWGLQTRLIPSVAPGMTCYYRVDITADYPCSGRHQSTTIQLIAGGDTFPVPQPDPPANWLSFPTYLEWPYPARMFGPIYRIGVVGETMTLYADSYSSSGHSEGQWRRDGHVFFSETNCGCVTLTNLTEADAGIYDMIGRGANGITIDKITLSVQSTNGNGMLHSPRVIGSTLVCELEGALYRRYEILSSTNLTTWTSNLTVTNFAETVTLSKSIVGDGLRFYRAKLVPFSLYY